MRQGATRHALNERKDDLYETPEQATKALLPYLASAKSVIWEPCAGRGAIGRILKEAGHRVVLQDLVAYDGADDGIKTPIDFLLEPSAPSDCTLIVTNPPYKFADRFVRHGLSLGCDVVVLLRLMAIEGAGRTDIMKHCRVILAGIERLPMMHREGWEGAKLASTAVPFGWFWFTVAPREQEDIALKRISWRSHG